MPVVDFVSGPKREPECDAKVQELKAMGFDEVSFVQSDLRLCYHLRISLSPPCLVGNSSYIGLKFRFSKRPE